MAMIIYAIAFIIILKQFNVEITPFIATLGIGGLAVGLALQNTLSNLFAGMHLISDEPIKVGDFIELDGTPSIQGTVEDIGWRSTRIKTPSNNIVIVPNMKLADSVITNDTMGNKEMSVSVSLGVSYGSNLDQVERVTLDIARRVQKVVPGAVKTHKPMVFFNAFDESNIKFNVILRASRYDVRADITHQFLKDVKKAYEKAGIQINYPTRSVYLQQGMQKRSATRKNMKTTHSSTHPNKV